MCIGINLAFAQLLAQKKANVIVADIQETPAFRKFQRATTSTKVMFQKTDVSDWKDLERLFEFARSELGGVDLLCNGAGVFEPVRARFASQQCNNKPSKANLPNETQDWSSFWKDTETESYKSLEINLQGLLKASRMAIRDQTTRSLSKGKGSGRRAAASDSETETVVGVILNISSLAAQYALFNQPLYCTSKAAVSSFTRAMAPLHREFGIKVVAIAPGMVLTPLWSENPDKMRAISEADVLATPEEVAETMLTLVESDKYEGGTVLEKLKETTREVLVDSPLPSGPGSTMTKMDLIYEDTIDLLLNEGGKTDSAIK